MSTDSDIFTSENDPQSTMWSAIEVYRVVSEKIQLVGINSNKNVVCALFLALNIRANVSKVIITNYIE